MRTLAKKQNQSHRPVSSTLVRSTAAANHHTNPIDHLQRTIGNQAVQRMLEPHPEELKPELVSTASGTERNSEAKDQLPATVHETLKASGQPLEPGTRAFMESRFGHDFGRVRIHRDAKAAQSAEAVKARAYTVGQDV